jgi:hypothetical protein
MLLDNPFNLSINPPVSDNTFGLAVSNCISLYFLIYILINNIYHKYNTDQKNYKNKIIENQYFIKPDILPIRIDDKYEKILGLLDLNSLDRHIILYFIFRMHGKFTSDTYINSYKNIIEENTETNEYNSFYEYNFWCNVYGGKNNFNLDETLPNNLTIIKDDKIWELNEAHINFLYWLNYSSLYDYIFAEEQIHIKKAILDDMNRNKVLIGNNFLKYQLFLINYEEMFPELLDSDLSDIDTNSESSDTQYDTDIECDNDDQTNKIVSVLGIADVDKYIFLEDLKHSFYNVCKTTGKAIYKSIFNVWDD